MRLRIIGSNYTSSVIIFYFIVILLNWPGTGGEDIVNARMNFQGQIKTDFWGPISSVVYGNFPNGPFGWETNLNLFQLTLTLFGLLMVLTSIDSNQLKVFTLVLSYFAILFAQQNTRDGLMISLSTLGIGFIAKARKQNSTYIFNLAAGIFIISASFRPWLGIAFFFVNHFLARLHFLKSKFRCVILLLAFISIPFFINTIAFELGNLEKSYPEQQVILMDSAGIYCSTSSEDSLQQSKKILINFVNENNISTSLCNNFRLDTWVWLAKDFAVNGAKNELNLHLIQPGNARAYSQIRKDWIKLIINDPVSYSQLKISEFGRVLVGGETRQLRLLQALKNPEFSKKTILAFLLIPYDLALSFHIFSLAVTLIIGIVCILFLLPNLRINELRKSTSFLIFALTLIAWSGITTFAYIGSNGRYMYLGSLLIYFSALLDFERWQK